MLSVRPRSAAVVGLALTLLAASPARAGLPIILPQDATWQYVNATAETTVPLVSPLWFHPDFDDSAWFSGKTPFANAQSIGDFGNATGPQTPDVPRIDPATPWAEGYRPYVRTTFTLDAPTDLTLWLAVDNGVDQMYLNGILVAPPVNAEGAAYRWEHVFDIPAPFTRTGENTLAIQLEDHGVLTGFVTVITADDDADNPIIPEPATGTLATLALSTLLLRRHPRR